MHNVLKSYLEHICGRENVEENVPMSTRTTFKIGGPARFFVTAVSKPTLVRLTNALKYIEYPYRVVGSGANILVRDRGFDGVIIRMAFNEIVDNQCFIYADAGARLSSVVAHAQRKGLCGLEWAAGIPGTVGGAVFMNAGAYGGAMSDVTIMVDALVDGEVVTLDAKACRFSYRHSLFQRKRNHIILGAYFFLKSGNPAEILARGKEILTRRGLAQPNEPSAGSVFRRPPKTDTSLSVGEMVERLNLKGTRIGGAQISEKHGGFIVNVGGATASDVLKLVRLIKRRVFENYNIRLKTEIEII